MNRPVIVVSDESLTLAEQLSARLGESREVVVIGCGYGNDGFNRSVDRLDREGQTGPEPVRLDIEDWNKRVEAKKLAKRSAKGK